jgi:predicted lactoylglutathione lyase
MVPWPRTDASQLRKQARGPSGIRAIHEENAAMSTKIFVNLPVKDLGRSTAFFTGLGFSLDQRFSDEDASCLVISDDIYAMLLTEPFFRTFTTRDIPDTSQTAEAIVALEVGSRGRVDELTDRALGSGGALAGEPMEEDGMYGRRFEDLDGHLWEVFHMDPAVVFTG